MCSCKLIDSRSLQSIISGGDKSHLTAVHHQRLGHVHENLCHALQHARPATKRHQLLARHEARETGWLPHRSPVVRRLRLDDHAEPRLPVLGKPGDQAGSSEVCDGPICNLVVCLDQVHLLRPRRLAPAVPGGCEPGYEANRRAGSETRTNSLPLLSLNDPTVHHIIFVQFANRSLCELAELQVG